MASKLTVGLSRKLGQPNYGSLGASCHVDIEVDTSVLLNGGEDLAIRVRQAFGICRSEVEKELAKQSGQPASTQSTASHRSLADGSSDRPSMSSKSDRAVRGVTDAQLRAIHAIAKKANVRLASQLEDDFGVKTPARLTIRQASELIETLKQRLPVDA